MNTYQLNQRTVMEYFERSIFYERNCNNEYIKMQQRGNLESMTGLEYAEPVSQYDTSFLIRKQYRDGPNKVKLLALYYVKCSGVPSAEGEGTVYPLPDIQSVFRYHSMTALSCLQDAIQDLAEHAEYSPGRPYTWKNLPEPPQTTSTPYPDLVRAALGQTERNHMFQLEQEQLAQARAAASSSTLHNSLSIPPQLQAQTYQGTPNHGYHGQQLQQVPLYQQQQSHSGRSTPQSSQHQQFHG